MHIGLGLSPLMSHFMCANVYMNNYAVNATTFIESTDTYNVCPLPCDLRATTNYAKIYINAFSMLPSNSKNTFDLYLFRVFVVKRDLYDKGDM